MSRFQAAVHNIGHHAVSGMSRLLSVSYEYCSRNEIQEIEIDLRSQAPKFEGELRYEIDSLREKYVLILTTTCGVEPNQVKKASLRLNFRFSEPEYQIHLQHMKAIGVWYGHDPLYDAEIYVELNNGTVANNEFSNRHIHHYA